MVRIPTVREKRTSFSDNRSEKTIKKDSTNAEKEKASALDCQPSERRRKRSKPAGSSEELPRQENASISGPQREKK